jgi:hypothetical protein
MSKKKEPKDRWTPVARGAIYCAPACGGGCTKAAFQKATREASQVAKRLGEGWAPHLNENLGWYWTVRKGPLQVSASSKPGYFFCLVSDTNDGTGGLGAWTPVDGTTTAATPEGAVKLAMKAVDAYANRIRKAAARARAAATGISLD